jgi:exodeoxyribonuclease VII large subunit
VQVQGEGAGAQIADALTSLNEQGAADVIIVGRGGGSMEDLWSFNEEIVVRAIVASRIPVVSAVGHEIDLTLADFAADHRAPTPSAAAEMVVPVLTDVLDRLSEMTNRIGQVMARYCVAEQRRLDSNIRGLAQIRFRIQEESQRTDEMIVHLKTLLRRQLVEGWERVRERQRELAGLNPVLIVKSNLTMIRQFVKRLERQISVLTEGRRMQIESAMAQLNSLSPLAILGRGYSILTKVQDGTLLRRALDVRVGDDIVARLSEGQLKCTVKRVLPDPSV